MNTGARPLPYGLMALLAPRYNTPQFLLPGPEPVPFSFAPTAARPVQAPSTVVTRPNTYRRTFTPFKPLTNEEIANLKSTLMYTGANLPATATITDNGLQIPMYTGEGGGDGVGNTGTGGPGPSASDMGNAIANAIDSVASNPMMAMTDPVSFAIALGLAKGATVQSEEAAPITSVSETVAGVGSSGFSSETGIEGFGAAADAVGGAGSGGGDSGVGMGADSTGEGVFKTGGLISLAGGGMANVAQEAKGLAALGRDGDTMLVHMAPSEVRGLQSMAERHGTSLSINPNTGLVEARKAKEFLKAAAPFLQFIPGVGPAISALGANIGLSALASQSLAAGIIGGLAAPGKGINFKEGLKSGLLAYGAGSIYNSLNPANTTAPQNAPVDTTTGGPSVSPSGPDLSGSSAGVNPFNSDPMNYGSDIPGYMPTETGAADWAALEPTPTVPSAATTATTTRTPAYYDEFGSVTPAGKEAGISNESLTSTREPNTFPESTYTPPPDKTSGKRVTAFEEKFGMSPTTALIGGNMAYGAYQASKEMDMYKAAQARQQAEEEEKRRRGREAFELSLGQVQQPVRGAGGGLVALARGGMTYMEAGGTTGPMGEPRMVAGTGDGMSDSVPATIEGVQEARLANDEFVIPADVVADIGNGSSSSGAKKLYDMMDRIRKARHGTTEQPPEIRAEKYMPA